MIVILVAFSRGQLLVSPYRHHFIDCSVPQSVVRTRLTTAAKVQLRTPNGRNGEPALHGRTGHTPGPSVTLLSSASLASTGPITSTLISIYLEIKSGGGSARQTAS